MRVDVMIGTLLVLGTTPPGSAKSPHPISPPPPDPERLLQGGDTIETALEITYQGAPYTGTTTGYTHDYDVACPWPGSTSPDVVYALTGGGAAHETWVFDLAGSSYDTKVYIYDSAGELVGCDDDGNPDFTSQLEVCFFDHDTYFIVIDGYGGEHGDYVLDIAILAGALVECVPGLWPEGETLEDGVLDTINCGCDCADLIPKLLELPADSEGELSFCGHLGWTTVDGELHQDTDWLSLVVGPAGTVHGEIMSTYGFEMPVFLAGDCDSLQLLTVVEVGAADPSAFDISADPGQEVWLVPNTALSEAPCGGITPQEYDYELHLEGLEVPVGVEVRFGVESRYWGAVKGFYR